MIKSVSIVQFVILPMLIFWTKTKTDTHTHTNVSRLPFLFSPVSDAPSSHAATNCRSTSTCTCDNCSFCRPWWTLLGGGIYGVNLFLLESARCSLITLCNIAHAKIWPHSWRPAAVLSCAAFIVAESLWKWLLASARQWAAQLDAFVAFNTRAAVVCISRLPCLHTTAGFQF